MRDEFKFRAWSKASEKMSPCASFSQWLKVYQKQPRSVDPLVHFDPKFVVLMQYTGLKDKRDKEIYEGDVVKVGKHLGKIVYVSSNCLTCAGFFVSTHELAALKEGMCLDHANESEIEIIGNIYENPDLLK